MSESSQPTPTATPPAVATEQKPYWLFRFAAWVGIVAGIVFIAAAVFFAGVKVSGHDGQCGHHHHHPGMSHDFPPPFPPPWFGPMGPMGPMGPGSGGPGPGGPAPSVTPPAPPTPPGH